MFDLLGWQWEYEPLDLDGYIPDFVLEHTLLVEVKPLLWRGQEPSADDVLSKITATSWSGPIALVGAVLRKKKSDLNPAVLGIGMHAVADQRWLDFITGRIGWSDNSISHYGEIGWGWSDPSGFHGKCVTRTDDATDLWREAGNLVQWHAVTPR